MPETESLPPTSAAGAGVPPLPERGLGAWIPGAWVLAHYRMGWLPRDAVAGLVLTGLLVPAGMGYAEAAGLPEHHPSDWIDWEDEAAST